MRNLKPDREGGRLIGQATTAAQNKKSVKCPGTLVSGGI